MQFQVPQFIEVEDKIFGPLTFRQFIYCAGGAGAGYLLYRLLPIYLAGPLILGEGALAAALAFFKYNSRPFIEALESGFYFLIHRKLYLWNNATKKTKAVAIEATSALGGGGVYVPKLSDSRLHELSWSLDINERIAGGIVGDEERRPQDRPQDKMAAIKTARDDMRNVQGRGLAATS